MLFSNKLFRIVIVPLSTTLGTVCNLCFILVQPVQSNLETKLPEYKIKSSSSTNLSIIATESGLIDSKRTAIEEVSSLASPEPHQYPDKTQPIQIDSQEAEELMEPEVKIRQKQEHQESANEGQKINLSSSQSQSSNSTNVSAIVAESELIDSKRTAIEEVSNVASPKPHQNGDKTQPIQIDSQEAEEPIKAEVEIRQKQEQEESANEGQKINLSSSQSQSSNSTNVSAIVAESELIDSKRTAIEEVSNVASPKPHQNGDKTQPIQIDSQEAEEPIKAEVETRKQSEQLSYIEKAPIEPALILASLAPHRHSDQTQPVQAYSQAEEKPTEQKVETTEQEQEESANHQQRVNLTLSDTVNLVQENNRTIKNSYLQRIIDRQELAVAEDEFIPNFTPEVFLGFNQRLQRDSQELSVSGDLEVKMPIGATLGVTSDNLGQGIGISELDFRVTFDQPLLKGFGVDINLAPIEIARLEEKVNFLTLKSILIGSITEAIEAYLRLLQAQEQIKIEQLALENAEKRLEIIQALIDAGRRARVELVQSETDVANREVSLLAAQNRLAQARLDLIEILDIERNLELVATDIENAVASISLEDDKLTQLAFANNPEYLQSLRRLEIEKFNLLLAENEQLWGLDLQVSYGLTNRTDIDDQTDVRAGIILSREFGNVSLEQSVERSQVRLEQANNNLEETQESLEIEIDNRIRDVKFNLKQIELAGRARELSEQQLENEREKLRLGVRGARLIDVLNFENDLVQAKNRELNTMIDYLSALTRLEQTVGITLDRWNIKVDDTALSQKE